MENSWAYILEFACLAAFIAIASFIKERVRFLQKYIVPTSILAGFIGLLLGKEILNIISLDSEKLGIIVYHLMAVGFIALSLKERDKRSNKDIIKAGMYIVSTYLIQGITGLILTLIFINTLYPDLFPCIGLLLPLGYGQGPGQAFSIGKQWENLGFINGGNIGLTFSTLGFFWASIIGVPLINFLIKNKKFKIKTKENNQITRKKIQEEMDPEDIPLSESLDKISIQLAFIGIVYLATYLTLSGTSSILNTLGTFGVTFSKLLWGFHFIIGSIYAIILRLFFNYLKKKEYIVYNYPNNYLLQRIAGGSFDFMITASITAISIYSLKQFAVPIILISTVGGIITVIYTIFMCKKVFKESPLENIVAFYGMQTGTISTGMALLREVDPDFKTKAAENLVLGSAVALFFGLPLMLILNIPVVGYVTGRPSFYIYTLFLLIAYLMILYFFIYLFTKNKESEN